MNYSFVSVEFVENYKNFCFKDSPESVNKYVEKDLDKYLDKLFNTKPVSTEKFNKMAEAIHESFGESVSDKEKPYVKNTFYVHELTENEKKGST